MAPNADWQLNYPEIKMRSAHLFQSREWSDCTFRFQTSLPDADSLDAHKLILAMASPVFAAMFYGDVGNKDSSVTISDIDLPTFSTLMEYIYTDSANITDFEAAINLYRAANKYLLVHLEKICLDYIFKELNASNACRIYEFACFYDKSLLMEKCRDLFINQTQVVLKSHSFLNAELNTVKEIVSMDTLDINSEMDLFKALINYVDKNLSILPSKWCGAELIEKENADHQTNEKHTDSKTSSPRKILNDIIKEIRFLSMTPAELANINEMPITLLSEQETLSILTNMFSPNSRIQMPAGFSCIKEPRSKSAATIRYTVLNVTNMVINQEKISPPCYVRDLAWRICAKRATKDKQEFLSLYLRCYHFSLSTESQGWTCDVNYELRLHSADPNKSIIKSIYSVEYHNKATSWGFFNFIAWDELIKPENKYIKDEAITVEVHFKTGPILS